ncbi:restriction endonuclease [Serratia marcescens]|uniref:nSTAND3 domain-containing NTPase n=1 Tax=Serratia marcescens TaxID=615 RepID=UPI0018D74046|nr:restriction endonuclease [Serratia marcescens]MDU2803037.1 restriction endonuclease [Serratia marcescens]MDU2857459.1 restriction endonuclease [Serratia marcescens]HEJ6919870.1 restriction endonuclease [Serratia marcescens]HEJ8080665.1 restriction endonuclease [Serratia marcescens]
MSYDFKNLSSADFEDLVRDLIGREEGLRFEAFCAGPDGGIDGRHAQANGNVILQAKHYEGSPFGKLIATMKHERFSIDKLAPIRYILATSCKFTPLGKGKLTPLIGPSLRSEADIFGPEDLNGLLRKYPDILKSHIKLWLSGAGVLDRVVRAAAHTFAAFTREDIEQKVRVYASNPSFDQSLATLEKHRLLIISGPPGVGKTTLAEMLCYTFLSEEWELVPIRSLEDGFAAISDSKKQVFLFDDFLGRVALDRQALAHKDSDLARFMSRVRRSPNARFILTTRGYIFEEARRVSEHLGDQRLDVTKYVLDVGVYTRRIKARILYNHLLVSETPQSHIRALLESKRLAEIVDHKNYNPRVIEAMTDAFRIGDIEPADYAVAFIGALNNPSQIWDTAFRTHIDHRCRHLLMAMFFLTEYGVPLGTLRLSFELLHTAMSTAYGLPHGPKDFEEALRILEGSFVNIVNISGPRVSFLNPSLKDYLSSYLLDTELLIRLVPTAVSIDWLSSLWDFVYPRGLSEDDQTKIALACTGMLDMIETRPHWRPRAGDARSLEYNDAANSKRLGMLMDWWRLTNERAFADSIMAIARNPQQGFGAWSDGEALIDIFCRLGDKGYGRPFIYETELLELLEKAITDTIRWCSSDMLSTLVDAVDAAQGLPSSINHALQAAVLEEFEENTSRISEDDSESSLSDRIDALKKFAPRFGVPEDVLSRAVSDIEDRIGEIEDRSSPAPSPSFPPSNKREREKFDDRALQDLFTPLLDR